MEKNAWAPFRVAYPFLHTTQGTKHKVELLEKRYPWSKATNLSPTTRYFMTQLLIKKMQVRNLESKTKMSLDTDERVTGKPVITSQLRSRKINQFALSL
jgi:hypothetical protein